MERKICVIEDDEKLCEEIVYFLNANGFSARAAEEDEYNACRLLADGFSCRNCCAFWIFPCRVFRDYFCVGKFAKNRKFPLL